jgi:hypothetical protein
MLSNGKRANLLCLRISSNEEKNTLPTCIKKNTSAFSVLASVTLKKSFTTLVLVSEEEKIPFFPI